MATALEPRKGAGPRSARTDLHPRRGVELSTRHPFWPDSWTSVPNPVTGGRLGCGAEAPSAEAAKTNWVSVKAAPRTTVATRGGTPVVLEGGMSAPDR